MQRYLLGVCVWLGLSSMGLAQDVKQAAAAALSTAWSDYAQGYMKATIRRDQSLLEADVELTWQNENVKLNVLKEVSTSQDISGNVGQRVGRPHLALYTPKETWAYFPRQQIADGPTGSRRLRLPSDMNILPQHLWLSNLYKPEWKLERYASSAKMELRQIDESLYTIGPEVFLITIDANSGFLPVRIESQMHGSIDEDDSPYVVNYTWDRDRHQTWYCRVFETLYYTAQRRQSSRSVVTVEEFDSKPPASQLDFTVAGLGMPKGTTMTLVGDGKRKTTRYGETSTTTSEIAEEQFQRLIDATRAKGFADPQRGAK